MSSRSMPDSLRRNFRASASSARSWTTTSRSWSSSVCKADTLELLLVLGSGALASSLHASSRSVSTWRRRASTSNVALERRLLERLHWSWSSSFSRCRAFTCASSFAFWSMIRCCSSRSDTRRPVLRALSLGAGTSWRSFSTSSTRWLSSILEVSICSSTSCASASSRSCWMANTLMFTVRRRSSSKLERTESPRLRSRSATSSALSSAPASRRASAASSKSSLSSETWISRLARKKRRYFASCASDDCRGRPWRSR
mmetsp:Transcript_1800/g.4103  ORF Transcript_1800/g.4103 Transcript_1800/m.4103 type:complete len:257 (+) Transcript_1800:482-1252(+)